MSSVTREHRAEAARLLGFEPAPSGWHLNVLAHRWVEGEPVPEWWLAEREQGALLPPVAQALADRDARIGELVAARKAQQQEEWRLNDALEMRNDHLDSEVATQDAVRAQLARVVVVLRALRHDVCGSPGCASRELRTRVDSILKELDHA